MSEELIPIQENFRQVALVPCKLIMLHMLDKSSVSLSRARLSDFILDGDYANYNTVQTAFSELERDGFTTSRSEGNRTFTDITEEGRAAVSFFRNRISDATKERVKEYLESEKISIREDSSVIARTRRDIGGGYLAELTAREGERLLLSISLNAPTEEMARDICDNWKKKNAEIYAYLYSQLI